MTNATRPTRTAQGILRRFRRSEDGIAAIEFALIIPILIGMYFMLHETTNGLRAARKVTMTARVMADLASRPNDITDSDRNDIFAAGKPIMSPFKTSAAGYRFTSVRFKADGSGYVDWSEGSGSLTKHSRCMAASPGPSPGGALNVPAALRVPNTSVIFAEVTYSYTPAVGYNITGPIALNDSLYMRPRGNEFVTRNGVTSPAC
ncbi:MAG: TadE/TadG family type IV pilus assembly protein [Beijerinckiaceae bacterium]